MTTLLDIGGVRFGIRSQRLEAAGLPANFLPFVSADSEPAAADTLLTINEEAGESAVISGMQPVTVSFNDLGMASLYEAADSWIVSIVPVPGEYPRIMRISRDFREATLTMAADDPFFEFVFDSMSRILFSQFVATKNRLMLHASVVEVEGEGFLFMGESGTGKSTHSRLWTETFEGCRLLNDDCPLIIKTEEGFMVSGTPWSGKTPCYRNRRCRVGGIAKLQQAEENRFTPLREVEAFTRFISGMSVMTSDSGLYSAAVTTALELLDGVPFGILECRPDREAAMICRIALRESKNTNL